jgi:hypothetical protein
MANRLRGEEAGNVWPIAVIRNRRQLFGMNSPPPLLLVPFRGTEDPPSFAALLSAAHLGHENQPLALLEQTRVFLETNPRPDPWGSYIAYEGDRPFGVLRVQGRAR